MGGLLQEVETRWFVLGVSMNGKLGNHDGVENVMDVSGSDIL